jgi:hypothetical protein
MQAFINISNLPYKITANQTINHSTIPIHQKVKLHNILLNSLIITKKRNSIPGQKHTHYPFMQTVLFIKQLIQLKR